VRNRVELIVPCLCNSERMMFVRAANLRGGRQARKMAVGSPLFRTVLIRDVLSLNSL